MRRADAGEIVADAVRATGQVEADMAMMLTSTAFQQGGSIPRKHTCDGENVSPPLAWSGLPATVRSLVLVCLDPDAPSGTFHHWAAHDIPPDWSGLAEGYGARRHGDGFREAVNDFGKPGYGGPCPPRGHGPHHYHFRLLALSEPTLGLDVSAGCPEVIRRAKSCVIESAELVGLYRR